MTTRTPVQPEPTPAGEPAPTPAEEVQPTTPPPAPEPEDRTREYDVEDPRGQLPPWRLSVGEAIAEVTRRVPAISKDRTADQRSGGYKFRGIDQVLEALHPILADVGLVILPGAVVREQWETRATSGGGTLNVARLLVRYTFVGPDGTEQAAEVWGEGGDSGDKATQKAHSQSYKTLCFQTFSIPTQQSAEDEPDATNPAARPFTAEELQGASQAWTAALGAGTMEELARVRQRAVRRLSVPVETADGGLAPLSLLFDQRRAELERAASPEGGAA